ncbi:MAG TPA: pyridoxal phosphate-dependent aminotransferase [Kutzneria sp.]|jgi:aminotransferase
MTRIANRMAGLQQSTIRSMTARCEAVGGINLGQGLCQVAPPSALLEHGTARFEELNHSYSYARGDAGLLETISAKLAKDNGITADPANQIVATVGATGAFTATLAALFNPGDGILVLEPCYGYHLSAIRLFELTPQPVRLAAPDFRLERDTLRAAVTDRTRAIVVCTPANPSGRRFDREELGHIAEIAGEHDLLVITDEIYEYIYYGDEPHLSPGSLPDLAERTVTISGLSKSYSIPGWRLGYVTAPAEILAPIQVAADTLSVCAPTPLQQLARYALSLPDSYYEQLRSMYDGKRRRLADAFTAAGMRPNEPEGAYYLFVDCSALGVSSGWEAADHLLEHAGVATIPGEAFCLNDLGTPIVRACFSVPDDVLEKTALMLEKGRS